MHVCISTRSRSQKGLKPVLQTCKVDSNLDTPDAASSKAESHAWTCAKPQSHGPQRPHFSRNPPPSPAAAPVARHIERRHTVPAQVLVPQGYVCTPGGTSYEERTGCVRMIRVSSTCLTKPDLAAISIPTEGPERSRRFPRSHSRSCGSNLKIPTSVSTDRWCGLARDPICIYGGENISPTFTRWPPSRV